MTLQRESVRLTEGNRIVMITHLNWGRFFMKLDTRQKDIKEAVDFRVCQKQVLFSSDSIFFFYNQTLFTRLVRFSTNTKQSSGYRENLGHPRPYARQSVDISLVLH